MKSIDRLWIATHGPMSELTIDGESGIALSQRTRLFLQRKGITLHQRGKDQHARYIERRGALLRDVIHRIYGQLEEEGIADMPFTSVLAEAIFCGNALLSVGNSTPYNGLYGRTPKILPSIEQMNLPDEKALPALGSIR